MTPFDWEILHRTVWGEARGGPQETWIGVTWVIKNRLAVSHRYGSTCAEVCLRPYQFSTWIPGKIGLLGWQNWLDTITVDNINALFVNLCAIADAAWNEQLADPTDGSTHYFDPSIPTPSWAAVATPTVTLGRLRFFKNVP